jgi:hypothetical protein
MMEMTAIPAEKNSHVESVGHDPVTQTLRVKFKNGGAYDHAGVPAHHHSGMLAADSPGKYFHAHIRGKYEHTKVE